MTSMPRILILLALLGTIALACSRPEPVRTDPPKPAVTTTTADKAPTAVKAKAPAKLAKTPVINGLSSEEQKALKQTYAKHAMETITLENAEREAAALEKLVDEELAAE